MEVGAEMEDRCGSVRFIHTYPLATAEMHHALAGAGMPDEPHLMNSQSPKSLHYYGGVRRRRLNN